MADHEKVLHDVESCEHSGVYENRKSSESIMVRLFGQIVIQNGRRPRDWWRKRTSVTLHNSAVVVLVLGAVFLDLAISPGADLHWRAAAADGGADDR